MAELRVRITDETGNQTSITKQTNPTPSDSTNKTEAVTKSATENKQNSKALGLASMIGARAFNYTTSNISKWTATPKIQQTISNLGTVASYGAMAYASSPYVALAMFGLQLGTTAIDNSWDNYISERESQSRRIKAGYNSMGEVVGRRK